MYLLTLEILSELPKPCAFSLRVILSHIPILKYILSLVILALAEEYWFCLLLIVIP